MKKKKNKGFSLVELIVVMAIMAILAVMLAPRLIQYVEKSRVASDQEIVNAIYNTTKLTLVDEAYLTAFKDDTDTIHIGDKYVLNLDELYTNTSGSFVKVSTGNTAYEEIISVIGNFKLKSKLATSNSDIVVIYDSTKDEVSALLDYNGVDSFSATPVESEVTALLTNANYKVTQ